MAILDNNWVFSSAQAITNSTTSSAIDMTGGVTLNTGNAATFGQDLGIGDGEAVPKVIAYVGTAFTTTNSGTLSVLFQGSTDSSTWDTYVQTATISAANLTAGSKIAAFDWPHRAPGAALPRYIRLSYTVGTGVFSAGTLNAYIGLQRQDWTTGNYPAGFSVGA